MTLVRPTCAIRTLLLPAVVAACVSSLSAAERVVDQKQTDPAAPAAAAAARLRQDVEFLASDRCEGRGVNTLGINLAAYYIASEFKAAGLKPAGVDGTYFQPFTMSGDAELGATNSLVLRGPKGETAVPLGDGFQVVGMSGGGTVTAPVVFAGFGITAPEIGYDDYKNLDAAGKIVVVFRKTPRADDKAKPFDGDRAAHHAALLTKLINAEAHKAAGVLFVNDRTGVKPKDELMTFRYTSTATSPAQLPAVHVLRSAVEPMFDGTTLDDLERAIDKDLKPQSRPLAGWTVALTTSVIRPKIAVKNVIGTVDGSGSLAGQTLVLGAHYDHLGYGGKFSLASGAKGAIHHGADDNASGTAALIELARRLARTDRKDRRRLVFMAFSGEESGLLGSDHYVKSPLFPLAETAAMLNMDMVGRLRPEKPEKSEKPGKEPAEAADALKDRLIVYGTATAPGFDALVTEANQKAGFRIKKVPGGFGPSDHASFYGKKIPVLFFFTGEHPDYHRPSDTADKINYPGMARVVDMVEEVAVRLDTQPERPAYVAVKEASPAGAGGPEGNMPRIGIRPDYGDDKEGVLLGGVKEGGPAAKAGLKEGDRIIEVGGKPARNLEAYMYLMTAQKKGAGIELGVVRDGKKIVITVKPE